MPFQMACNVPRQVAATYKTLWERAKSNVAYRTKGWTKRRYKELDKPPRLTALAVTLNGGIGQERHASVLDPIRASERASLCCLGCGPFVFVPALI